MGTSVIHVSGEKTRRPRTMAGGYKGKWFVLLFVRELQRMVAVRALYLRDGTLETRAATWGDTEVSPALMGLE